MSVRSFIAVEIEDPAVYGAILRLRDSLGGLGLDAKLVEDENIHITIRFLGEVSPATIECVKRILDSVAASFKRFSIKIRGVGAFPNTFRPRVVWVGVSEGSEILSAIRSFIDKELIKCKTRDIHMDKEEFVPHITIARMRSARNVERLLKFLETNKDADLGASVVTRIKLKKSILTPRGPIYEDLYVVSLG